MPRFNSLVLPNLRQAPSAALPTYLRSKTEVLSQTRAAAEGLKAVAKALEDVNLREPLEPLS